MASPQYDVEQLIANIKRRCSVPTSQLTYENSDFTILANDELQGQVVPLIMSTREEYFVNYVDVPAPSDGIIAFPENTVGGKVRSVCYLQQESPLVLNNLPRIDLDVIAGVGANNNGSVAGFYIQGNDIILYPSNAVSVNNTIRIYYYQRTLFLASPENYGQIVAIDTNTNTVQLDFVPTDWDTDTVLNAVSSTSGFGITNEEMTVVTVSSPSIVLDNVTGLSIGDYISEQGYSAVPQIPIEAHAYLAQLTAAKCLEGLGDRAGMQAAEAKAAVLKESLLTMISQRVDGSVKKVINPSGGIRLASSLRGYGRGRY